jgi:hypothetical protein
MTVATSVKMKVTVGSLWVLFILGEGEDLFITSRSSIISLETTSDSVFLGKKVRIMYRIVGQGSGDQRYSL